MEEWNDGRVEKDVSSCELRVTLADARKAHSA